MTIKILNLQDTKPEYILPLLANIVTKKTNGKGNRKVERIQDHSILKAIILSETYF